MNLAHIGGQTQAIGAMHHDLDGALRWMSSICGPHRLQVVSPQHLDFVHTARQLASMSTVLGRIQYGTDVVIGVDGGCALSAYSISLPIDGEQELRTPDGLLHSDSGTGLIVAPGQDQELSIAANCNKLQVVINRVAMHEVLEELLQRPAEVPLVFEPRIDARDGATASWWRTVRHCLDEMQDETSLLARLPVARDLERTLIKSLILSQPSNYTAALESAAQAACPAFVLRARAFIHAQADDELRLRDIEQAAGVSAQRLHDGFKRSFGLSPTAYLKKYRLQRARKSLLEGQGLYNVAAVASQWGFGHLGRFSSDYFKAFGEMPSLTLARAQGRH